MKKLLSLTLVLVMVLAIAAPTLAAPSGFVGGTVVAIDKKGYDSYDGKEITANNSTTVFNGFSFIADNKTLNAWYVNVADDISGTLKVAYKVSSNYYIITFAIDGPGKYYIADSKGSNGANMVKIGAFVVTPPLEPDYMCEIVGAGPNGENVGYYTLEAALEDVVDYAETTIRLLKDIHFIATFVDRDDYTYLNKLITFDLNDLNLTLQGNFHFQNCSIKYTGDGSFSIWDIEYSLPQYPWMTYGFVTFQNCGEVQLTYIRGMVNFGNVADVVINGNIDLYGLAFGGASLSVRDSKVTVNGNVTADIAGPGVAVGSFNESETIINGDIIAAGDGIAIYCTEEENNTVTVNGTMEASGIYIALGLLNADRSYDMTYFGSDDYGITTSNPGYLEYTNDVAYVWILGD